MSARVDLRLSHVEGAFTRPCESDKEARAIWQHSILDIHHSSNRAVPVRKDHANTGQLFTILNIDGALPGDTITLDSGDIESFGRNWRCHTAHYDVHSATG